MNISYNNSMYTTIANDLEYEENCCNNCTCDCEGIILIYSGDDHV